MERRSFTPEFKSQAVARALQPGANKLGLARELEISNNVLHRWIRMSGQSASPEAGADGKKKPGRPRIVRTPQAGAENKAASDRVSRSEGSVVSTKRRGAAAPNVGSQQADSRPEQGQQMGLPELDSHVGMNDQGGNIRTEDAPQRGRGRPRLTQQGQAQETSGGQRDDLSSMRQSLERVSQERDMLRQMLGHYFSINQ
jgi:transposase-like protein